MDAIECIKARMSIRKFKPDPLPKELLLDIIRTAQWSPSYKNSQPWEIAIVSGDKKEALAKKLIELIEKGVELRPDMPVPLSWPETIESRINETSKKRSEKMGFDPVAPDYLKKAKIANSRFYGAPHGIFFYQDASLTPWSILDMGFFAQSLMLAANAHGIGTVPQAFLTDYSDEIKRFLELPESKRVVLGMSIGYPDLDAKIVSYRTERVDAAGILRWIE